MLRRITGGLFQAPPGAEIQVVAEAQGNNGVNDARFEYAGTILPRDTILGLPGCTFTVAGSRERLEAGVVFDPGAPGAARYDLFEIENGVKSSLNKSVRQSDGSPLISFAIDPAPVAVRADRRGATIRRSNEGGEETDLAKSGREKGEDDARSDEDDGEADREEGKPPPDLTEAQDVAKASEMKILSIALFVMALATQAGAQPALPTCKPKPAPPPTAPAEAKPQSYQDLWCDRVLEIDGLRRRAAGTGPQAGFRDDIDNVISVHDRGWPAFLLYAQARSTAVDAGAVEDARTDKQIGAPAGAGSTSLVSKGSVPGILGFAVENGALTQSTSGTTVTLRGNLVGWLDLLKNQDFIASYQDGSSVVRGLRRVSYSLTLNTDTGGNSTASVPSGPALTPEAIRDQLESTKQQVAGYSVRIAVLDRRDPRTAANRAAIATLADTKLVDVLKADNAFDNFLNSDEYLRKWAPETVDLLSDLDRPLSVAEIQRILYQRIETLRLLMINRIDGFDDAVARNLLALQAYDKARLRLFETIRKQPLVAFEYVNTRSKDLPDYSTFRFIAEGQWGSRLDLTANIAFTFQGSGLVSSPQTTDLESGRRDFQLAGQMDVPLGSLEKRLVAGTGIGAPVLGIAFLSQKLTERAAVSFAGNTFMVDDPGWIHAVQAKVTVPVKGSGVKIPFSVSYSNRTELLDEKDVRGHIGVTFDMDVLSSVVRR